MQLVVTVGPAVGAETVVDLTASPRNLADDFALAPSAITIAAGGTSGAATLRATTTRWRTPRSAQAGGGLGGAVSGYDATEA